MRLALLTPPATDGVVTLDELKIMLGITSDAQDDLLTAMRDAVVGQLDPAAGGWLGRALAQQTWEMRLDYFCDRIRLPYRPTLSVDSFKYDDADGVEQSLDEGVGYRLFGLGGTGPTEIAPVYQGSWPSTRGDDEAIRIVFTAGYAAGEVPAPIKSSIALGVRHLMSAGTKDLHLARDEVPGVIVQQFVVSEAASKAIEAAIGSLLSTYRVYG